MPVEAVFRVEVPISLSFLASWRLTTLECSCKNALKSLVTASSRMLNVSITALIPLKCEQP